MAIQPACCLPTATEAHKVETRRRHLIHMAPEVDLEVNSMEVLPAGPRRPRGEPLLSQLSVADTI